MGLPGYRKPTHGWGQDFSTELGEQDAEAPAEVLEVSDDEEWAGPGFTVLNEESAH